jgi:hypothetical protein
MSSFLDPTSCILFPVVERPVQWLSRSGQPHEIPGHKALVRPNKDDPSNGHVLSVVKNSYKLVTMHDILVEVWGALNELFTAEQLSHVLIQDTASYHGGVCLRSMVFPDVKLRTKRNTDIALRIIIQNGYGLRSVKIIAGAIDFFCTNGMIIGEYESAIYRHTSGLTLTKIVDNLKLCINSFHAAAAEIDKWSETHITAEYLTEVLEHIGMAPRVLNRTVQRFNEEAIVRGENLWALHSALTHHAAHGSVKDTGNDAEAVTRLERMREASQIMRDVAAQVRGRKELAGA